MFFIPEYVQKVVDTLMNAGYEAFIVGGPVRDLLLGNAPDDYDITTACLPDKIIELFHKTIVTGIKHGTVTVVSDGKNIEVTTFRTEGNYLNNRSPEKVNFVRNVNEDLARRDFTINAMAYSKKTGIIDLFGGRNDLKNGIIKCVGNPETRFTEDALRILRAFRFAAKLNFKIEDETLQGIIKTLHLLPNISRERVWTELNKILISKNPQIIEKLINLGGLKFLGIEKIGSACSLSVLPNNLAVRFYAFCHISSIDSLMLCQELKTDNKLKDYCIKMNRLFGCDTDFSKIGIKHMLNIADIDVLTDYFTLLKVLHNKDITAAKNLLDEIISNNEPYLISHLAINGDDVQCHGFTDKQVGIILKQLLEKVIADPKINNVKCLNDILNSIQ